MNENYDLDGPLFAIADGHNTRATSADSSTVICAIPSMRLALFIPTDCLVVSDGVVRFTSYRSIATMYVCVIEVNKDDEN